MCTVSWLYENNGYQLLCNRDEKKTRLRADIPRIESCDGVQFIAPSDPVAGGTWIAANEFGLVFCLLNATGPARPRSRGHVVLELVSATCLAEVKTRLAATDLSSTSPFTLAVIEPLENTMTVEWKGQGVVYPTNQEMFLTSSSFETEAVCDARRKQFGHHIRAAKRLDATVLYAFHEGHGEGSSAYSTCMHRADAETVSFSWIKVNETVVDFFYTPAAPCQWHPGETHRLRRR